MVVASLPCSRIAFFQNSGAPESRVATNRVPSSAPTAPKARAATMPRPSAMPPAAITGTLTASTIWGTRAMVPTCAASREAGLTHRARGRAPPRPPPRGHTGAHAGGRRRARVVQRGHHGDDLGPALVAAGDHVPGRLAEPDAPHGHPLVQDDPESLTAHAGE